MDRHGDAVSVIACLILVGVLLVPYTVRPAEDIDTYYGSGLLHPLFAGALAVGVVVVFAAVRRGALSPALGAGFALGLSLVALGTAMLWAVTVRLDVFRAPGWAFPAQRWVVVALAAVVAAGATWQVRSDGLLASAR